MIGIEQYRKIQEYKALVNDKIKDTKNAHTKDTTLR